MSNGLIEQLASQRVWEEFLAHRLRKGRFSWREFDEADLFVEGEKYLPVAEKILAGGRLEPPCKKIVNKMGTEKKRVVYSYCPEEMAYLKALSFLLYKYDHTFAPNCYAFRRGIRATDAVLKVNKAVRGRHLWAYKADIHDYFNSIPVEKLLPVLKEILLDDPHLYSFFERMLSDDRVVVDGEIVREQHGVMAGVPTAPFLADVCLSAMDHWFEERGVVYARYSDDIIVFAEDADTLGLYKDKIREFIASFLLEINPSKEKVYSPDEPYEFLGFKCLDETIDISDAAIEKMKGKIRRKMRSTLRWKKRKGISDEEATARMIRYFNKKFYDIDPDSDGRTLTWARWYFPVLTTTAGLSEIDHYLQQSLRTVFSGHHKTTGRLTPYATLQRLGYLPLVHEYYQYLENK